MSADLEGTAIAAIHKAAIDYSDGLTANGQDRSEAALTAMGALLGEAALIAYATGLTAEGFRLVAETIFEQAELLAQAMKDEK